MSWGFEFVANTRDEAIKGIDAHARRGLPPEIADLLKSIVPYGGFGDGISMIVKSNGHIDTMGPSNCSFEIRPANNTDNAFYK